MKSRDGRETRFKKRGLEWLIQNRSEQVVEVRRLLAETRSARKFSHKREAAISTLYSLYEEGCSLENLGRVAGFSVASIHGWFKKNPKYVRRRPSIRTGGPCSPRRWALLNEDAFESINTPEAAYWLGFLWADGYVIYRRGRYEGVRLELHCSDKGHVEKFARYLGSNAPVKDVLVNEKFWHARVFIWSSKLASDLAAHGLVPRRSELNVTLPSVPREFERDFVRGLFDGDGEICRGHKSKFPASGWIVGFTGSCAAVDFWHLHVCEEFLGKSYADLQNGKNFRNRVVRITGPGALMVLDYLYSPGDIALDSHQKLAELLSHTARSWEEMGLDVIKRGDGFRFIHTDAVPEQCKEDFVEKIKALDRRATLYWRF